MMDNRGGGGTARPQGLSVWLGPCGRQSKPRARCRLRGGCGPPSAPAPHPWENRSEFREGLVDSWNHASNQ
jgi:hypothetical protein